MFKTEIIDKDGFTDKHVEAYGYDPRDGYSNDYRNYLVVWYNNIIIMIHSDGGEPEDNSFHRDWSWVSDAIEAAYQLGYTQCKIEYGDD